MSKTHTFHIPVMGIGFTIDTPLKVAHLGIDSVISLVDDILIEKLRKMYAKQYQLPYEEITEDVDDFRAKRITSYLNLVQDVVNDKIEQLKNTTAEKSTALKQYIDTLPDSSTIKKQFAALSWNKVNFSELKKALSNSLSMGSIDVNIMTKVDKENYKKKELLPTIYNDAHAALRGFAHSKLSSSLVLSAGMNPRLYSYIENFGDFYPDAKGNIKKKIILKVSDYRSALIQGKFLAKKGIWVSEYRIESGLNCGGHAFATDGYLIGPILEQFKINRTALAAETHELLVKVLEQKNYPIPAAPLPIKITAQGGVGTAEEHQFLIEQYGVDSVGWGSPFLLVPEATTVDDATLDKLAKAKEEDLYLSDISPLGVPFNNLKGNTKDAEKQKLIAKNRPGSACPKKFVALNKEFTEQGICTASRQYQHLKIKELEAKQLNKTDFDQELHKITEKSCTCVGLGTSALLKYDLGTKVEGEGVSVCPGPNMAYFSKKLSLKEIIGHIYGKSQNIVRQDRPNMFTKELQVYIDYIQDKITASKNGIAAKDKRYFGKFIGNLKEGIAYYQDLLNTTKNAFEDSKSIILNDLSLGLLSLQKLNLQVDLLEVKC